MKTLKSSFPTLSSFSIFENVHSQILNWDVVPLEARFWGCLWGLPKLGPSMIQYSVILCNQKSLKRLNWA